MSLPLGAVIASVFVGLRYGGEWAVPAFLLFAGICAVSLGAPALLYPRIDLDGATRTVRIGRRSVPTTSVIGLERKSSRRRSGAIHIVRLRFERERPVRILLSGNEIIGPLIEEHTRAFATLLQLSAVPGSLAADEQQQSTSATLVADGRYRAVGRDALIMELTGALPDAATPAAIRRGADVVNLERADALIEAWMRDDEAAGAETARLRSIGWLQVGGLLAAAVLGIAAYLVFMSAPRDEDPSHGVWFVGALVLAGLAVASGLLAWGSTSYQRSQLHQLGTAWWDAADAAARERGIPEAFEGGWNVDGPFRTAGARRRIADEWVRMSGWRMHPPAWFEDAMAHVAAQPDDEPTSRTHP